MKKEVIKTADGVSTLFIPEWNETYHSKHGVLAEARHVFIENGLNKIEKEEITILEIGFGTGFNALLTFFEAQKSTKKIHYFGMEKFPISWDLIEKLNYEKVFESPEIALKTLKKLHSRENYSIQITENFQFTFLENDFFKLQKIELPLIDLVYFDAFGARVQPELWEKDLFQIIHNKMSLNSLFTTYSSKGSARRALEEVGFKVSKLAGPKGKREMINAIKT